MGLAERMTAGFARVASEIKAVRAESKAAKAQATRRYLFNPGYVGDGVLAGGGARWMRIASLNGHSPTQGAHLNFLLSGSGDFGGPKRSTVLVHIAERNGAFGFRAWGWGHAETNGPVTFFAKTRSDLGSHRFELWARFADYNPLQELHLLARERGEQAETDPDYYARVDLDMLTNVQPTGLTEYKVQDSDGYFVDRGPEIARAANWNTLTANGSWQVSGYATGITNHPADAYAYGILVVHTSANVTVQNYYPHGSTIRQWTRASYDGGWTAWQAAGGGASSGGSAAAPSIEREYVQEPVTWLTTFQSGHGFGVYGNDSTGTNLNNTASPLIGTQYATVRTQGGGQFLSLNGAIATSDMTGRVFVVRVRVANPSQIGAVSFSAGSTGTGFASRWDWPVISTGMNWGGGDLLFFLPWRDANVVGTPDRTAVNAAQVTMYDRNTGGKITVDVTGIGWVEEPRQEYPNGVVTIGLDDCHASQASLAWPLMAARGMVATLFPITGLIGQSGRLTDTQIQAMVDGGSEVGLHAATLATHSAGWPSMSSADRVADMAANREYITSRGWPGAEQSAYPNGTFDDATVADLRKYAVAGRTTAGSASERMIPRAPMPFGIKAIANPGGSGGPTITQLLDALDRTRDDGGWLNLILHDFTTSTPAVNQMTVNDLATLLDGIVSRGIAVRTQGQVLHGNPPAQVGVVLKEPRALSNPITPATGVTLYAKRRARVMPAVIGPRGHDVTLQPHLGLNKMARWAPGIGAAALTADTMPLNVTNNGGTTATSLTVLANSSMLGQCIRTRVSSTTTAGTGGNIRGTTPAYYISTAAAMGGFDFRMRFGVPSILTGSRAFIGLINSVAATIVTAANPDALSGNALVGVGWASSDTPNSGGMSLYLNEGSGANPLKTVLPVNLVASDLYELHLYSPPGGGSALDWCLRRTGLVTQQAQGTATTRLPANTLLAPFIGVSNGAAAALCGIELVSMTCETDN